MCFSGARSAVQRLPRPTISARFRPHATLGHGRQANGANPECCGRVSARRADPMAPNSSLVRPLVRSLALAKVLITAANTRPVGQPLGALWPGLDTSGWPRLACARAAQQQLRPEFKEKLARQRDRRSRCVCLAACLESGAVSGRPESAGSTRAHAHLARSIVN